MNIISYLLIIIISSTIFFQNNYEFVTNKDFISKLNTNKLFIYNNDYCFLNSTQFYFFNNYVCTINIKPDVNVIDFKKHNVTEIEDFKNNTYFSNIKTVIFYYLILNLVLNLIGFLIFNRKSNDNSNLTDILQNSSLFNTSSDINVDSIKNSNLNINNFIGCNNIKKDITKVINQIKYNNIFKINDCELPRGILLIGPPGCGKTHLVNTIINSTGINYIFTSGSDFNKIYVGSGTQTVSKIFKKARENKPCLIFIDEADSIIKKRSHSEFSSSSSEFNSTVCKLLAEMDSLKSESGIILVFATNMNEDFIDKAMLRSGRIDQIINISYPTFEERIDLFKLYLKDLFNNNIDLNKISKLSYGLTGADIKKIINSIKINKIYNDIEFINKFYLEFMSKFDNNLNNTKNIIDNVEKNNQEDIQNINEKEEENEEIDEEDDEENDENKDEDDNEEDEENDENEDEDEDEDDNEEDEENEEIDEENDDNEDDEENDENEYEDDNEEKQEVEEESKDYTPLIPTKLKSLYNELYELDKDDIKEYKENDINKNKKYINDLICTNEFKNLKEQLIKNKDNKKLKDIDIRIFEKILGKIDIIITTKDIDKEINKTILGLERDRKINEENRKIIAYHEAGHAIMSFLLKDSILPTKICISINSKSLGYTMYTQDDDDLLLKTSYKYLLRDILILYAGRSSERVFLNEITCGAEDDLMKARKILKRLLMNGMIFDEYNYVENTHNDDKKVPEFIEKYMQKINKMIIEKVNNYLYENKVIIDETAELIMERNSITGEDIKNIFIKNNLENNIQHIDIKIIYDEIKKIYEEDKIKE